MNTSTGRPGKFLSPLKEQKQMQFNKQKTKVEVF